MPEEFGFYADIPVAEDVADLGIEAVAEFMVEGGVIFT